MEPGLKPYFFLVAILALAGLVVVTGTVPRSQAAVPVYHYRVVTTYPHDPFAFTEGLAWSNGSLYESTGLTGNSSLREVALTTGEVVRIRNISGEYFGEGITVWGDRVAQLTQDSHTGIVYERATFRRLGNFSYPDEGWGLAWDGRNLIMSDGTSTLYFLDPTTYQRVRSIDVRAGGLPVTSLNELEYVNGEVYANIWPTDRIARIDPQTGSVTGWIDLTGLLPGNEKDRIGWSELEPIRGKTTLPLEEEACLNGIAYDAAGDRLFVTGKLWPDLFEIRIVPA